MKNLTIALFVAVLVGLAGLCMADVIYIKNPDGTTTKQEILTADVLAARHEYVYGRIQDLADRNNSMLRAIQANQIEIQSLNAELVQIDAAQATIKP